MDIRHAGEPFQREAIHEALDRPATERRAQDISERYDDDPTEDRFWTRLEKIVNSNPRVMYGV